MYEFLSDFLDNTDDLPIVEDENVQEEAPWNLSIRR